MQPAQAVRGGTIPACLAHSRLVRPDDRRLVLVDAIPALRPVDAFLGSFVAKLHDLDALDLPAHRIQMLDGIEKAVDGMTADGIRTKIRFRLRCPRFLLRVGERRGRERGDGEQRNEGMHHGRGSVIRRSTHATPAPGCGSSWPNELRGSLLARNRLWLIALLNRR